ncbi:thiamine-phosphate pyrophosphorylase [Nocardioides sp. BE266]|uniref:thiamine phosphate synthase n=1 Tax=Nocardioides sp. BE266 TaxID=2817725 RepID=UPI00285FC6FD|nr:thiamine phosphate synthase [Nocardioides sp. BE266]MDR7252200.1 thiamine-phosphate pyrophosphorylase [Nocardioides sp. BE266]
MPAKEVIHVLLPRIFCLVSSTDDLSALSDLAEVGVDGFQVRDKAATTRELVELTRVVLAAVRPFGATVVVDDRVDVALATGADGVHLGAEDLPVELATTVAPELIVGATCRDRAAVERAAAAGAAYAGFGPVFPTSSKAGLPPALGVPAITAARGVLPLVAIGGIGAGRVRAALDAGAHGVAVLGAIWREPDPVAAAEELVQELG